jgi:hypothetical protein
MQLEGFGRDKTAGCIDLLQITYLPEFDYFVTNDDGMLRVARYVASRCRPAQAIQPSELGREFALDPQ